MRTSIIIPAWNLWETTASCLHSLARHDAGMQVVVVDNGSSDATGPELEPLGRKLFGDRFRRVRLPENLGFAAGCNAGARAADGDALLFLNNDTQVSPGWLPPLEEALAAPGVGAVGPLLLYPDGRTQHCGVSFTLLGGVRHLYADFPGEHPAVRREHPLQAITGAALLLRRADFEAAGGFCDRHAVHRFRHCGMERIYGCIDVSSQFSDHCVGHVRGLADAAASGLFHRVFCGARHIHAAHSHSVYLFFQRDHEKFCRRRIKRLTHL